MMRRSVSSLILLASLVLGGLLGPVAHLTWMLYGMDSGMASHMDAAIHDTRNELPVGIVSFGVGETAAMPELLLPGQPCAEECLFLVLLASQSSALAPEEDSLPAPHETPTVWISSSDEVISTADRSTSARDPPDSA